jgi:hypothetical protein
MPTTNAPDDVPEPGVPPTGVRLSTIAGWLGLTVANLHKRIARAHRIDLGVPAHTDFGRHRDKIWDDSTGDLQWQWENWNARYEGLVRALISRPPATPPNLSEQRLRALFRTGVLAHWMEDLASVLTDLVRLRDPAASLIPVPTREPSGRLQAVAPWLLVVNEAYIDNLRAWAREYAQRILTADAVIDTWRGRGRREWRQQLRKYLGTQPDAVLHRAAAWQPRKR